MSAPKKRILALAGRMGAGKSYIAWWLATRYNARRLSLAAPLKQDLVNMGFPAKLVYKEKPDPIRALMQAYGQAWRYINEDYWLDKLFTEISKIEDEAHRQHDMFEDRGIAGQPVEYPIIVIDDLRFPNELDALDEIGAVVVRVVREGGLVREQFTGVKGDTSEMALNSYRFEHVISAPDGALLSLKQQADELLLRLGWIKGGAQ